MNISRYKVKSNRLRQTCNPSIFKFQSTKELKPLRGIIGQSRAIRALDFGLDIENFGYNIYLSGLNGTGKTTLAREMLETKAKKKPSPSDWCYVFNFQNQDNPTALELPAGKGKEFKKDIANQIEEAINEIIKTFESDEFEYQKNEILKELIEETNEMYLELDKTARSYGFSISRTQEGIASVPLKDGEAMPQDAYITMTEEEKNDLMKKSTIVQEKINEAFRKYKDLEKGIKERIKDLETKTAINVTESYFQFLSNKYGKYIGVKEYLDDMNKDLIENVDSFVEKEEDYSPIKLFRQKDKKSLMKRYQVNLFIDNSHLDHAPVIFESNPTYANLFGQIEYEGEFGILATDFLKIKPGSIHKANGGYLVLHLQDLANNFYVWDTLKRVIKNREIIVESLSKNLGLNSTETLQPQAIPTEIKIILIGEPIYYYLLYSRDEEFQKLFKIKAEFDIEMPRTTKYMREYARFISSVCEREGLKHFNPEAVASVVEHGIRLAEDKTKLTTLFSKITELIYESNGWARNDKAELVERKHVIKAITEKNLRSSLREEKIQEYIKKDTLMINVNSKKIGEINGLAVYELGDHIFGKPVRITAKTFRGEKGLVNIEREIKMSGNIHSKGVFTLNGYMGDQYAQDKPLSLSASLTFEQSYQGIEGDSASSAELFALLSSLAGIPINQGIAVTGSVNQNGEIQPVGGVNQKIEGFYKICKEKGFNGRQGIIIPQKNVAQLMLDEEVVEAVKARKFSIWAIEHIDEGIEILTGYKAGTKDENGVFSPQTFHCFVNNKLKEWSLKRITSDEKHEISDVTHQVRARRRRLR
ncbi:ATP-dependent protease La [Candidatus Syntrophocurvum alkaliphilum]|uniref:endopeptidase La n=1 Tax=Candidatus Syntrophocurvum alkaliphilum TaxID=2293317 RepID=A0A6I6DFM2_9FIRM|nr:ATP-binding protein [Candidatus Syntrophocurvum alkaliphilum]QGT99238.1 ATP-dependent protease La [Candidatus Syntrophocurvum alkaliphilum]